MSKQRNREEKIPVVPLYSGPVKVLAIPPFGASSNNGLWRAKDKPPVELVVANLEIHSAINIQIAKRPRKLPISKTPFIAISTPGSSV